MGKFGDAMSARAGKPKTDNHAQGKAAKLALRRWLLAEIGPAAYVIELFAGTGAMHRAVWRGAASAVGADLRFFRAPGRRAFVCDNSRLVRAIALPFTIFDLDAYGSPWPIAELVAARRKLAPGERVGFAFTDGSPMRARLGRIEAALARMAGVDPELQGMSLRWAELTARAVAELAARMGGEVQAFRVADSRSRPILYSAAILRGVGELGEGGAPGGEAEQPPAGGVHAAVPGVGGVALAIGPGSGGHEGAARRVGNRKA